MRGYDVDEVRAFLQTVAGQMDDLIEEHAHSKDALDEHKGKMGHLEDVQEALQATLNMARKTAEETRQAAMTKAEMVIHEAHLKGEEILRKAERELEKLRSDITNLESRRDQMVVKLKSVLAAEMEMLDTLRSDPADRYRESGIELAGLEFVDPAARAHKAKEEAKAAALAATGATPDGEEASEAKPEGSEDQGFDTNESASSDANPLDAPVEKPDIAEVVASLKASVDQPGESEETESDSDAHAEHDEMQKIRKILDDLE